MLFTSAPFLVYFLPLAILGYSAFARLGRRHVIAWLVVASLVFYAYWNPRFLVVLLVSLLSNFAVSKLIAASPAASGKRRWMIAGVVLNLTGLCYFKYMFPLLNLFSRISTGHHTWNDVLLPLGISFFTFTQIAYLIDLSEDQAIAQDFLEYALFVTFFPHLIAGPILHHGEMMPQFSEDRDYRLKDNDVLLGLSWFVLGLAKKTLLADRLGSIVEPLYRHASTLTPIDAWLAVLAYSLQLYFDFSGYSDMAIGLARVFSIRFPFNFDSPYKATSIIEFWSRWHMTLTRYLTLYVYNPISMAITRRRLVQGKGISRKVQRTLPGFLAMLAWPTMLTMFLAGIWHGAGLQFLIFGLLHGIFITINHAWRNYRHRSASTSPAPMWHRPCAAGLTYLCVLVAQVFFRAGSTRDAITILASMSGLRHIQSTPLLSASQALFILLFPVVWFLPNTQEILGQVQGRSLPALWRKLAYTPSWNWSIAMGLLLLAAVLFASDYSTFLYFQF